MSKVDITVELDRASHTFHPGETITGRFNLIVNEEIHCESLKLYLEWVTRGKGTQDNHILEAITYVEDQVWTPGTSIREEFEVTLDDMPYSYEGRDIQFEPRVLVEVDIPRPVDKLINVRLGNPHGKAVLNIVPTRPEKIFEPGPPEFIAARQRGVMISLAVFIVVALLAVGEVTWIPLIAFLGGFIIFWIYRFIRNRVANTIFDAVDLALSPAGNQLLCKVKPTPRNNVNLSTISGNLILEEYTIRRGGTKPVSHQHRIFTHSAEAAVNRQISNFEASGFDLRFDLPDPMPLTFDFQDNKLRGWIEIDIPTGPLITWRRRFPFTVRPATDADSEFSGSFAE